MKLSWRSVNGKGRDLVTHVSISQNPSRDRCVESGCIKSVRKDNLINVDEETPPKIKETNLKPHEIVLSDSEAWTVISKETVVLQPRAKHTVLEVQGGNCRNSSCLLCVEPANVPIEGICVARVLIIPRIEIHKNQPVGKCALFTSCTIKHTRHRSHVISRLVSGWTAHRISDIHLIL